MKWKKIGKIFDPTQHKLANNCKAFAQSPQTLVFDDFVRVYFSTRETDSTGKYLSHISFVDFDKKFQKILNVASDTVIPLGDLGCYDQHGMFPMHIFRKNNKEIYGYISGINRRVSVSVESSIGLAISTNQGLTFEKIGPGPIVTSSLYEPYLVCDPFVQFYDNVYHMWYAFGTKWIRDAEADKAPSRVYKIGHATSADGVNWVKEGRQIIEDKLNENECAALPTVIHHNGAYHMYFCYRQSVDFRKNRNNAYRLGYATSTDLKNWKRNDDEAGIDVTPGSWDSDMMCYPHIFRCDDKIYLLYNGNEFGRLGFGIAVLEN